MDARNLLKPMLARGELHCIGATTLDEYRKHIEKDAALERRFQPVLVDQPSVEDTISILRGLRERYEVHHGVRIKDAALVAAAALSHRYIADRFLPDKAIDLRRRGGRPAAHRDRLDARRARRDRPPLMQLEIEREALKKETDEASARTPRQARGGAVGTQQGRAARLARNGKRRRRSGLCASSSEQIEETKHEIEQAERAYDLNKVAELKYGTLAALEARFDRARRPSAAGGGQRTAQGGGGRGGHRRGRGALDGHPGVQAARGRAREAACTSTTHLHQRVVGQDEAVQAVADAVLRARAGIKDPNRPDRLVHLPGPRPASARRSWRARSPEFSSTASRRWSASTCPSIMEKHTVARLIGAPPGYVGFEEGGQLTEARPRADPTASFFSTRSRRRTRRLQRPVAGARRRPSHRRPGPHGGLHEYDRDHDLQHRQPAPDRNARGAYETAIREEVLEALRRHFRPEFLNRVDDMVVFHALDRERRTRRSSTSSSKRLAQAAG